MNHLDIKYKFLIAVFILWIPVYLGDALLTQDSISLCGLFSSLMILDMGLIVLFYWLMIRAVQQSKLQIYLTLADIMCIGFAFAYLINHFPNGL